MEVGINLVFVKSIPRPSVLGLSEWTNKSGVKLDKTKVGHAADFIRALYSSKVGGLANYISYHPWLEKGSPVLDEHGKQLMLQQKFERDWNLPVDYLTNKPLNLGNFITRAPEELTYFQSKSWKLNDGTTVFDISTLDGAMGYYVCLASSKVANNEREYREHKWPKATHFIFSQTESEEIKYNRTFEKTKAFAVLHDPLVSDAKKVKIAVVLGITPATAKLNAVQIHNLLYSYIDASSENVKRFLNVASMDSNVEGRKRFDAEYLLQAAMDSRVILERQDMYTWVRPDAQPLAIGNRRSEAIDFLLNPKKAKEVEDIMVQVKEKIPHLVL